MKTALKALGLVAWLVLLAFFYGAIWNRHPNSFFPVPPEPVSNWIATHFLSGFNIEDKTDILVFLFSFVASCGITFCIWIASKFWKNIR